MALTVGKYGTGKIGRTSLSPDNRFVIMVNAGSKGSPINIAQMISCLVGFGRAIMKKITMYKSLYLTGMQGLLNMNFDQSSYFAQYPLLNSMLYMMWNVMLIIH